MLPILFRAPEEERSDIASVNNLQIWSPAAQQSIPLRQVVQDFETTFEDEIVQRLNRKTTITVHADPAEGTASALLQRIRPQVEALEMGPDYELEWWGEYRDSKQGPGGHRGELALLLPGDGADRDRAVQLAATAVGHLAHRAAGGDRGHGRPAVDQPALRVHGAAWAS